MKKNYFKKAIILALAMAMIVPNYAIAGENINNQENKSDEEQWNLVWSDEFNGNEIDTTKWAYETGSGYNNEKQYYTKDNFDVSDGSLKIIAKKESKNGYSYTSGRLETITENGESLFSTKYGKIEARIKLPAGTGLWPAFWMMPVNDEYGDWPLSGEIDIMEARGRVLNEVNGTIHFGEKRPFNRSLGSTYTFEDNTDITDYHIYSVEWKENEIIWFVDGIEYYRTSNWYTMNDGVVSEYPAPFNQEFYLILNLAVGGDYDNGKLPSSTDLPGIMEVDYVRVYHNKDGYSSENIYMPEGTRDEEAMKNTPIFENGNLLSDINFATLNKEVVTKYDIDLNTHNWFLLTNKYYPAKATASTELINGETFANIKITDPGTENYSLQLKQKVSLAEGFVYKVSFDAKSNTDRTIKVKPYGLENYCSSYTANLTNELQHFEFSFLMKHDTDMDATLEFNIGKYLGDITIGNIKVEVINTYVESERVESQPVVEEKPIIKEAIKNGDFSQGIAVWNVVGTYYDIETKSGNTYGKIYTKPKTNPWDRMWIQDDVYLTKGKTYKIEFMAKCSSTNQKFAVTLEDDTYAKTFYKEFRTSKSWKKYSYEFVANTDEELTLKYFLGMVSKDCKLYLDDVSIKIVE